MSREEWCGVCYQQEGWAEEGKDNNGQKQSPMNSFKRKTSNATILNNSTFLI